ICDMLPAISWAAGPGNLELLCMDGEYRITGRIVAAARALAGIGQADLSTVAGVSVERLSEIETKGSAWLRLPKEAEAIIRALDHFGVVLLDDSDGMGAGVRLKFTRQDVRQIVRLEGEGGIVAPDDAP